MSIWFLDPALQNHSCSSSALSLVLTQIKECDTHSSGRRVRQKLGAPKEGGWVRLHPAALPVWLPRPPAHDIHTNSLDPVVSGQAEP